MSCGVAPGPSSVGISGGEGRPSGGRALRRGGGLQGGFRSPRAAAAAATSGGADEAVPPAPEPVEAGEITEELRRYDGSDPEKPLLMAIKGQIYDVSQSRMFYGPGGPYASLAGKDASRALAKMSFEPQDLNGDISGLGPLELSALQDWEYKFNSKYVKVGTIRKTVPSSEVQEEAAEADVELNEDIAP